MKRPGALGRKKCRKQWKEDEQKEKEEKKKKRTGLSKAGKEKKGKRRERKGRESSWSVGAGVFMVRGIFNES